MNRTEDHGPPIDGSFAGGSVADKFGRTKTFQLEADLVSRMAMIVGYTHLGHPIKALKLLVDKSGSKLTSFQLEKSLILTTWGDILSTAFLTPVYLLASYVRHLFEVTTNEDMRKITSAVVMRDEDGEKCGSLADFGGPDLGAIGVLNEAVRLAPNLPDPYHILVLSIMHSAIKRQVQAAI
ncbi:hypothetical protein Nepgr_003106 [Nepenthes gracilis]|uniref:Uncharacterized protein n=1 Tax=Nepenthes gracilis TaxID=150966 RepID=A0AAD3RYX4_NEPGR|nr:hypothetical protein Nepgr_003106 [Nepenthes gracilis]